MEKNFTLSQGDILWLVWDGGQDIVMEQGQMLSVTIHGVRGSLPATGIDFSKYGGNTTCFEIETEESQIFIDAGTGFSSAKIASGKKKVYLLFTHLHHDHLQGLLHNPQLFIRHREITVSSALMNGTALKQYVAEYFSPPFFPPSVFSFVNCLKFVDFEHFIALNCSDLIVDCINLNHPGGAIGYSFTSGSKKVVIALDNEFESDQEKHLVSFCENADILIWDGMYTNEEMENKRGWGHSTIEQAINFTQKSTVKKTVICHHSPSRSDAEIDTIKANLCEKNIEFGAEGKKFIL